MKIFSVIDKKTTLQNIYSGVIFIYAVDKF